MLLAEGELYVPDWDEILASACWCLWWLCVIAGVFLYRFPDGVRAGSLRIAAVCYGVVMAVETALFLGAFGRFSWDPRYMEPWAGKMLLWLTWGRLLGNVLAGIGALLVARSLVKHWRTDPLAEIRR